MYRHLVLVAAVLTVSACRTAAVTDVQPIDGVISGQCHVDMVRGAVGLAAAPGTVERARVDSDSLHVNVVRGSGRRSGATSSQVADATGGAPAAGGDRLSIDVGRTNNITAIYCG